jgi:hypothetical protein
MKKNLKIMEHGFCAEGCHLGELEEYFQNHAWFGRYIQIFNLGLLQPKLAENSIQSTSFLIFV